MKSWSRGERPHRKCIHECLSEVKGEQLVGDAQQHRTQFPLAFSPHLSVRLQRQTLRSEQAAQSCIAVSAPDTVAGRACLQRLIWAAP